MTACHITPGLYDHADGHSNALAIVVQMKILQLRMELKRRGKPMGGSREELAERLAVAVAYERATLLLQE